ncbi:DUF1844 domain-containing protein [Hippea maritima]|uniref:DUF1844 domain-containing protein n=1 Tax=Hippea maritima (strain ATCC 700847 / DSM 10411 / MH2) TaxID=760142 RepID=F2LWD2_HIPMA|nr:DUF1844 domain-containing protein [Hippea maritima]AEA34066.1 Domain of unknown function DUF1844 [Hippea maritima DSM 10411]
MSQEKATFIHLIVSMAEAAYVNLGVVEDPFTKKKAKDLKQAKYTIDMLEVLKEKTKGNLNKEEEELFDEVLYDLRVRYLEESKQSG